VPYERSGEEIRCCIRDSAGGRPSAAASDDGSRAFITPAEAERQMFRPQSPATALQKLH
jgi:hypothetical protein